MEGLVLTIRGQRVMLDSDLAALYGVELKRLNEQVRRNAERFPDDFAFQLTHEEFENLKSQFATSSSHGGKRKLPWTFTEHGVVMLASVLKSATAVAASVKIVRVFLLMREQMAMHAVMAGKLADIERRLSAHDAELAELFSTLHGMEADPERPRREIGFHVREEARLKAAAAKTKK